MGAKFEWQTEEEGEWEDLVELPPPETNTGRVVAWRLSLIVFFMLLGMTTLLIRRQVLLAEDQVSQEVLAVNTLAAEAAYGGDTELFRTFLSGRDASWTDTQLVLADQELALGSSARLFGLEPRLGEMDMDIVYISPALNEVELEVVQYYFSNASTSSSPPIALKQNLIYRKGSNSWLLSPPEDKNDYWGTFQSLTGRYLTVLFPSRDIDFVQQFATDMEIELANICAQLASECPDDWHITLRLERNPASLLSMSRQKIFVDVTANVVLPTPSLIGQPIDDTGYEHLYQVYANTLIGLTLTRLVEYKCCHHIAYYSAMLSWYMSGDAYTQWPLEGRNYSTLVGFSLDLDTLQNLYSRTNMSYLSPEEEIIVHAFVEFMLLKATGQDKTVQDIAGLSIMTQQLATNSGFWSWVESMSNYVSVDKERLVQDWVRFIAARMQSRLLAEINIQQKDIFIFS